MTEDDTKQTFNHFINVVSEENDHFLKHRVELLHESQRATQRFHADERRRASDSDL